MEEFIFDVLLLVIGIIIGRGYTLDQMEERRKLSAIGLKNHRKIKRWKDDN